MPRTRTDLIVKVLDLLNVTQVGQDPSAEDSEKVDADIDGLLAELGRRRVVFVANSNAIDDEYFDPLARLLANRVAGSFGASPDADSDVRQEVKLREMQQEPGADDVVHAHFF